MYGVSVASRKKASRKKASRKRLEKSVFFSYFKESITIFRITLSSLYSPFASPSCHIILHAPPFAGLDAELSSFWARLAETG